MQIEDFVKKQTILDLSFFNSERHFSLASFGIFASEIAFDKDTPNFVVDITKIPINILQDYGFVTRELTDEDIAAEALLKLNNNTFKIGGHLH